MNAHVATVRQSWAAQWHSFLHRARHTRRAIAALHVNHISLRLHG